MSGGKHARLTRLRAGEMCLFASMGMTLWRVLGFLWPNAFQNAYAEAGAFAAVSIAFFGLPACFALSRTPVNARTLSLPTPAQAFFALIAACAGLLFADDITLLWAGALNAAGLPAGRALARIPGLLLSARTPGALAVQILCLALIPAACEGLFFRWALFRAWERGGTRFAVAATAAMSALFSPSLALVPQRLILGLALGALLARGGSAWLPALCHAAQAIAFAAASYVRGADAAMYQTLFASLGGGRGIGLLALETALLGAAYALTVRAACLLRPRGEIRYREKPAQPKPSGASATFLVSVSAATAMTCFLLDLL